MHAPPKLLGFSELKEMVGGLSDNKNSTLYNRNVAFDLFLYHMYHLLKSFSEECVYLCYR